MWQNPRLLRKVHAWNAIQGAIAFAFLIWLGVTASGSVGRELGIAGNLAILGLWAFVCYVERRRLARLATIARERYGVCPKCAYPLQGDSGVCPECGRAYTMRELRRTWRKAGAP